MTSFLTPLKLKYSQSGQEERPRTRRCREKIRRSRSFMTRHLPRANSPSEYMAVLMKLSNVEQLMIYMNESAAHQCCLSMNESRRIFCPMQVTLLRYRAGVGAGVTARLCHRRRDIWRSV